MRLEIVAEKITDLLEKQGLVEPDQAEVYVYGMTLMISSTATLLATLLLGFVFHAINNVLVFLLFFVPVRIFSGGYHSSSYLRCFLTFMLMLGSFIAIQRNLPEEAVLPSIVITSLISLFLIFKFSPVSHPNAPIRESDWFRFKRLSRIICIIEISSIYLILIFASENIEINKLLLSAAVGLLYASIFIFVGWIQVIERKEVTEK